MIVRQLIGPEDNGYELIAMGIESSIEGGHVIDALAIHNITDLSAPYSQTIRQWEIPCKYVFTLKEGHRRYVLTSEEGRCRTANPGLRLGRPGNEDQIQTTFSRLLLMRARYALDHGTHLMLGPDEFIVITQLGTRPGLLFFRADMQRWIDRDGDSGALPDFFVQTMRWSSAGGWEREAGPLTIEAWNNRSFELVWNWQTSLWQVRETR